MKEYVIFNEWGTQLGQIVGRDPENALWMWLLSEGEECEEDFYVCGPDGAVTRVYGDAWFPPTDLEVSVEAHGAALDWKPGIGLRVMPTDGQWLRVGDHDWAVGEALIVRRDCDGWPYGADWKSVGATSPWRLMPTAESIQAIIDSPESGELDGLVLQAAFAPVLKSGRPVSIQLSNGLLAVKIVNDGGEAIAVVMPLRPDCGPIDHPTVNHLGEPIEVSDAG